MKLVAIRDLRLGWLSNCGGAQNTDKPTCGLLADPEGFLASPLSSSVDCDETEQSSNSHRQGLYTALTRERRPFSFSRETAARHLGVRLARGVGAGLLPPLVPSAGLCEQSEQVVWGDPDHKARQQGLGELPGPQQIDGHQCLCCPLGRLQKVWLGLEQARGAGIPKDSLVPVSVVSRSYRRELWCEMLSSLERDWRSQAYRLLDRRFQKEVTGVQAPGEAEKPPSCLGRKTTEGSP